MLVAVSQLGAAPGSHAEALDMLSRELERSRGADILVLPELALCGYGDPARIRRLAVPVESRFIADVRALAQRSRMGFITGYAEQVGGMLFNSALAVGPDGVIRGNYRKVNLWGAYERGLFAPGLPSPIIAWGSLKLGLLICYDLEFPESARDLVLRGADIIVVLSATSGPYHVVPMALVPARAYETGCYMVFANWTGIDGSFTFIGLSRITAPDGSTLMAAPAEGSFAIQASINAEMVTAWRKDHDYLGDRRPDLYTLDLNRHQLRHPSIR